MIDKGSMDKGLGMIFSEYMAIFLGSTDLLEKVKLEKKVTVLESERKAFRSFEYNRQKEKIHFLKKIIIYFLPRKINPTYYI